MSIDVNQTRITVLSNNLSNAMSANIEMDIQLRLRDARIAELEAELSALKVTPDTPA